MTTPFKYQHLYYFWVIAKVGSMSKAAESLGLAIQTISVQVHELEKSLGFLLFKPAGRGIALTEAGFAALKIADQISRLAKNFLSYLRMLQGFRKIKSLLAWLRDYQNLLLGNFYNLFWKKILSS